MTKICKECYQEFDDEKDGWMLAVFSHYIREHPRSKTMEDVMSGLLVTSECGSCGREFGASVDWNPTDEMFHVPLYCEECRETETFGGLFAQPLEPEEVVEREVANG